MASASSRFSLAFSSSTVLSRRRHRHLCVNSWLLIDLADLLGMLAMAFNGALLAGFAERGVAGTLRIEAGGEAGVLVIGRPAKAGGNRPRTRGRERGHALPAVKASGAIGPCNSCTVTWGEGDRVVARQRPRQQARRLATLSFAASGAREPLAAADESTQRSSEPQRASVHCRKVSMWAITFRISSWLRRLPKACIAPAPPP